MIFFCLIETIFPTDFAEDLINVTDPIVEEKLKSVHSQPIYEKLEINFESYVFR